MMNALHALDHCHAMDITHRDLHPGNLFVDNSHDGEKRLLIGDFGQSIDWSNEEQALQGIERSSKLSKVSSSDEVVAQPRLLLHVTWCRGQTALVPTAKRRIY